MSLDVNGFASRIPPQLGTPPMWTRRWAAGWGAGLAIFLLAAATIHAVEAQLTDEQRSHLSAVVLTGMVVATNFVQESNAGGALYAAQVHVESVEKADAKITNRAVIYFPQPYTVQIGNMTTMTGRVCPPLPHLTIGQRAKMWCLRHTESGHTNILFIPSASWIKVLK